MWPFPPPLTCEPNPVFILTKMNLPYIGEATLYPIQLHGIEIIISKDIYTDTYSCYYMIRFCSMKINVLLCNVEYVSMSISYTAATV